MTTVWKRAVHPVYRACLSRTFISSLLCFSFRFDFEDGMWLLIVLVPDHFLYSYFYLDTNKSYTPLYKTKREKKHANKLTNVL